MSTSEPTITDYTDASVPAVSEFMLRNFPDSPLKARPDYIRWRCFGHPRASAASASLLAERKGRLCGNLSLLPDRIHVNHAWHDAVWLYELFVEEQERRTLLGPLMVRTGMRRSEVALITGAAPKLERMLQALGWKHLAICRTFFWVRRPSRVLRMAADAADGQSRLRTLAGALKASDWIWRRVADIRGGYSRYAEAEVHVEEAESAPDDLGAVSQACSKAGLIITCRDPAILDWKFSARPAGRHVILHARARATGEIRGYLTAKLMMRPGVASWADVVDYVVYPGDMSTFQALVRGVQQKAAALDLDFVRCRCSLAAHTSALARTGWIDRTRRCIDDVFVTAKSPEVSAALEAGQWHLTALVSDRSDYGRDEWPGDPAG